MVEMTREERLSGVMPALLTPLNGDESLNKAVLRDLVAYEKSQGAKGFYISGATGEGLLLSMETRKELYKAAVQEIGKELTKIIHVSDINFATTKYLARYAEEVGADYISIVPPLYFDYNEDDLYHYYKAIAAEVHIPLMLYYTPAVNVELSSQLFRRLTKIDNITSVKWTMPNYFKMIEFQNIVGDKMSVINGPDEMLLCGLAAGAVGGIGTTYNYMLPWFKEIYEKYRAGDMAGALLVQKKVDRVISALREYKCIPCTKVILEAKGFPVGNAAFPMKRYTQAEKEAIIAKVKDAGLTI